MTLSVSRINSVACRQGSVKNGSTT